MKAGKWIVALVAVLGLGIMLAIVPGCGKNVAGPTAPKLAADSDEMSETEALQNYSAACHNPGRWIGPRAWVYQYLINCTPAKILKMGDDISSGYFNDPVMVTAIKRITTSNLFYLIMFKQGLAWLITDTATQILSTAWSPNEFENPGNFPCKVTLLPLEWNTYKLFHGALHSGWVVSNNTTSNGYALEMTSTEGNTLNLQTYSLNGDIFKNSGDFYSFMYNFQCQLANSHNAVLDSRIQYSASDNNVFMIGRSTWMMEDGTGLSFDDIHFSTADKSGRVHIISVPANLLNIELDFNSDGSGTGTMDIKNVHGVMVHYDYSQTADGHGWWMKNNGKKHNF
jgi:hypothetical protein